MILARCRASRSACSYLSLRLSGIVPCADRVGAESNCAIASANSLVVGCRRVMGVIRLVAKRTVYRLSMADIGLFASAAEPAGGFCSRSGRLWHLTDSVCSAALMCLLFQTKLRNLRYFLPLLAIWLAGFGLQHVQWTEPQGEPVTVSLLQGNISQDMKWRADQTRHLDGYLCPACSRRAQPPDYYPGNFSAIVP